MEEENSVQEEVAPQEDHVEAEVSQPEPQEEAQEKNWRELRKQKQYLEDRVKTQQEILDNILKNQAPAKVEEPDEFDQMDDDEYLPKGKVSKLIEKRAQEIARKEAERFYQDNESKRFLDRLKSKYSDFDDVVTADSIARLEQEDPELAETIAALQDPYKIGMQSYKYIKALGLGKQKETPKAKETNKKLKESDDHVQSPMVYDKRPMAQAFRMTQEDKKKLYDEMMFYANQGGNL